MSNPSQPRPNGDRPDALARNFSAQLKSDFNLEGDLPTLSSHLEEQKHAIVAQRQVLHRLEAQLEETEEALAQAGIAPDLSTAMHTQGAGHGSQGMQTFGGQSGAAARTSTLPGGSDAQRMANDVYTEGDYQGDASIRRLGGEGFSMSDTETPQQGVPSTYGSGYQQSSANQQDLNRTGFEPTQRGQSDTTQQKSSVAQPMSERILEQQDSTPISPKATGYQQLDFSRPIEGNVSNNQPSKASRTFTTNDQESFRGPSFDDSQRQQLPLSDDIPTTQPAFGHVHQPNRNVIERLENDGGGIIGNYHVAPGSVQVPYRPAGSS